MYIHFTIYRITKHLRPLAIATNMAQAQNTRLDQVVLMFGFIYLNFLQFKDDDEATVRDVML